MNKVITSALIVFLFVICLIQDLKNEKQEREMRVFSEKITRLEFWAAEAVGNFPWTQRHEEQRKQHKEKLNQKILQQPDPVQRQKNARTFNQKSEGWTYHEIRPLKSEPWIEWTEGDRNPDPTFRPSIPPRLQAYIEAHPEDSGSLEHGWKDTTIDGGYLWEQF